MDADLELVGKARDGDMEAFEALVQRHQHRLVHFARLMVSNPADAEDVAQETLLRAYRALGQFRGQSAFRTWLYQIATNVARTHLAKRRDRHEVQEPEGAEGTTGDPGRERASGEDVEQRVIAHDQLRRALADLPGDWREAVVLRDIEGLDYKEIAALLGIPMGTVESRIFRGRQRLKATLKGATHD
ncbi:MAG: sigma-70 family RNA polymerase sigma factor [Acidobacteria bacterium]|nr:sigma-70 family RNA polymerase sigma factor [Acidobacteriota bacterium]